MPGLSRLLKQPRKDPRPSASANARMPDTASTVHVQRRLSTTCMTCTTERVLHACPGTTWEPARWPPCARAAWKREKAARMARWSLLAAALPSHRAFLAASASALLSGGDRNTGLPWASAAAIVSTGVQHLHSQAQIAHMLTLKDLVAPALCDCQGGTVKPQSAHGSGSAVDINTPGSLDGRTTMQALLHIIAHMRQAGKESRGAPKSG